jgi:large subunit ribosomal protein L4
MAELPIIDAKGKAKGGLAAADSVFGSPVKTHVMRLGINAQLANGRAGTHSSRTRGMVRGGGAKPFKQKGTGRARQGTSRSPLMPGGAIIFGPKPRKYRQCLNKKVKRQAITSALSALAGEGAIKVIDDFGIKKPQTKEMAALLARLNLDGGKTLILLSELTPEVALSARNIPYVKVASTEEMNVLDLVNHDAILTDTASVRRIEALLGSEEAAS